MILGARRSGGFIAMHLAGLTGWFDQFLCSELELACLKGCSTGINNESS
jgi:hypothetical protein